MGGGIGLVDCHDWLVNEHHLHNIVGLDELTLLRFTNVSDLVNSYTNVRVSYEVLYNILKVIQRLNITYKIV